MTTKVNRHKMVKITLILATLVSAGDTILVPCVTAIYGELQTESVFLNNFIVTGPSFVGTIAVLLVGAVTQRVSKRPLLIISYCICVLSSTLGAFAPDMPLFAISRLFYGSFNVVTFGLVTALIAESFRDDKERGFTVGYYQGLGCVHGVVISILAGRLATVNWRYAQLLNFIPVIVVPLLFFFIPHTPPERKAAEVRPDENREAFGDIRKYYICMISNFACDVVLYIAYYFVDVYVSQRQLGDSSFSGLLSSVVLAAMTLVSFVFAHIYNYIDRYTVIMIRVLGIISFLGLAVNTGRSAVIVLMFLLGLSIGLDVCYYPTEMAKHIPRDKLSLLTSVFCVANALGFSCCSYLAALIQGILGTDSYQQVFMVCAVLLAICLCGSIAYLIWDGRAKQNSRM